MKRLKRSRSGDTAVSIEIIINFNDGLRKAFFNKCKKEINYYWGSGSTNHRRLLPQTQQQKKNKILSLIENDIMYSFKYSYFASDTRTHKM